MSAITYEGPNSQHQGKETRVVCSVCNHETVHTIVRSAEYVTNHQDGNFFMTAWSDYQIVECRGCQEVSFRRSSRNTEDEDFDMETQETVLREKVEIFPHRLPGRTEIRDSLMLPPGIRRAYQETLEALTADMAVLAGVGLRAIVETICKDLDAQGGTLETKLDDLVSKGVLTQAGADILHSLRIMGNAAAHEVKPHAVADLTLAMDVVEHTLQGLFILPQRAANLPQRARPPA